MGKSIELLSPAGNMTSLLAAVQSGADAVYIGGESFNARAGADNFTIDAISRAADYCHLYGADLHVAVNTLIKEREMPALAAYAKELNFAGADALIVQDLGAAEVIKQACPDIALHASTQMTVTSVEGVKFLEKLGFSRVVLARELSYNEIKNIVKNTNAEIEVFVHGAICMCYSGQCLMSSIIGGRSANRGRCAQPCRLPYTVTDKNGSQAAPVYALSPKDMALINELSKLKEAGVTSLKIEGRLKRAEYVSAVTGLYRKYLDSGDKVTNADMAELKNAFSRSGFTQGYFKNSLGADMMSHKTPGNVSDNIFTTEAKLRAREDANVRKIPVTIYASLKIGEPLSITITDNDYNSVTVTSDINAERANNAPISRERLTEQLKKLGNTPFEAEVFAETDNNAVIAVKEINSLRRRACEELTALRTARPARREGAIQTKDITKTAAKAFLTAECETYEQAMACADEGIEVLYVPKAAAEKLHNISARVVVRTADIFTAEDIPFENVMISSPAAAEFYKGKRLYGSHRLNIFNSRSAEMFSGMELITLSPELNINEAHALIGRTSAKTELIAYGRLTLMLMKNCPLKALDKCQKHKAVYTLKDRKNEEFPVLCTPQCTARLLNSKPVFMADKLHELKAAGADALRLIFTIESKEEAREIVRLYKAALDGGEVTNPLKSFTRGHYYRGVE